MATAMGLQGMARLAKVVLAQAFGLDALLNVLKGRGSRRPRSWERSSTSARR